MTDLPPDLAMRRADHIVTTALDTLAILLFGAAAGWWGWTAVHPATGLAAAGLVITIMSVVAQRQPRPKSAERPAEDIPPGPKDPGNIHVMGR